MRMKLLASHLLLGSEEASSEHCSLGNIFNNHLIQVTIICAVKYVSKVSSGFEFFLLTFAYGSVLALYLVVLGVECNSASNGALSDTCCSAGNRSFTPNTEQNTRFPRYLLLKFAHGLVLALWWVVLDAEFNSASSGASLDRGCREKSGCSS